MWLCWEPLVLIVAHRKVTIRGGSRRATCGITKFNRFKLYFKKRKFSFKRSKRIRASDVWNLSLLRVSTAPHFSQFGQAFFPLSMGCKNNFIVSGVCEPNIGALTRVAFYVRTRSAQKREGAHPLAASLSGKEKAFHFGFDPQPRERWPRPEKTEN